MIRLQAKAVVNTALAFELVGDDDSELLTLGELSFLNWAPHPLHSY